MTENIAERHGLLLIAAERRLQADRDFRDALVTVLASHLRSAGKKSLVVGGKRLSLEELRVHGSPSERQRKRRLKSGLGGPIAPWEHLYRIKIRNAA